MHRLNYDYNTEDDLDFDESCHYYLDVPVLYDLKNYLNSTVQFLFDTGAYVTVLNNKTSLFFGFDKLPSVVEHFPLTGISGSCDASLKEIPGMVIGGRLLKGVKVAIPHDDTKYCILGLNVLDHFKYLIDSELCKVYFNDNPNYKMPNELKSAAVMNISGN